MSAGTRNLFMGKCAEKTPEMLNQRLIDGGVGRETNQTIVTIGLQERHQKAIRDNYTGSHFALISVESYREVLKEMTIASGIQLLIIDLLNIQGEPAVCQIKRLRKATTAPIIAIVPAEISAVDVVFAGADMWLQHGVTCELLISGCHAMIRRYSCYNRIPAEEPKSRVIYRGKLMIDPLGYQCQLAGKEIAMQPRVFRLLVLLASNPKIVFTREMICNALWPDEENVPRDVSEIISDLRKALGDDKNSPSYIETIHGVGYRFIEKE